MFYKKNGQLEMIVLFKENNYHLLKSIYVETFKYIYIYLKLRYNENKNKILSLSGLLFHKNRFIFKRKIIFKTTFYIFNCDFFSIYHYIIIPSMVLTTLSKELIKVCRSHFYWSGLSSVNIK